MRKIIVTAVAAVFAAGADAQWLGEFVLPPADPGFVLGWISPRGNMREYVPRGESVERWTRMVTVQQAGYRAGLTPALWLRNWGMLMQRGCPGATIGTITPAPLDEHDGARLDVACPSNPATGLPESVVARAILGEQGIQMIQAAARRRFSDADTRWADGVTAGSLLCATERATGRCAAARIAQPGAPL